MVHYRNIIIKEQIIINILSLFDGISCGQLALQKQNIEYDRYFSSEIDNDSMKVTQHHFPNTIQLGNVIQVSGKDLPKIDLIMGGSPCQGFSFAGKRLNFNDPRSKLFFEFIRLLNKLNPRYFLLENVKMKKEYQDVISNHLGVEPILINSSLISKQNRKRLYWTNIPIIPLIENDLKFNNYLYRLGHGYIKDEIKFFDYYPTLTAQSPGSKYRVIIDYEKQKNQSFLELRKNKLLTRVLTPIECEELQTLPNNYTSMIKKTKRYQVIGNGWTVDVIKNIFRGMKNV